MKFFGNIKVVGETKDMKHPELWNRFIDEVYGSFLDDKNKLFSDEQKNAIIAFACDSEVNSGGAYHIL